MDGGVKVEVKPDVGEETEVETFITMGFGLGFRVVFSHLSCAIFRSSRGSANNGGYWTLENVELTGVIGLRVVDTVEGVFCIYVAIGDWTSDHMGGESCVGSSEKSRALAFGEESTGCIGSIIISSIFT